MPVIRQAIIEASPSMRDQDAFERKILAIRKQILNNIPRHGRAQRAARPERTLYAVVLQPHRGYKGLLLATQVGSSYQDLLNPLTQSALALGAPAVFHQHVPVLEAGAPVPVPGT